MTPEQQKNLETLKKLYEADPTKFEQALNDRGYGGDKFGALVKMFNGMGAPQPQASPYIPTPFDQSPMGGFVDRLQQANPLPMLQGMMNTPTVIGEEPKNPSKALGYQTTGRTGADILMENILRGMWGGMKEGNPYAKERADADFAQGNPISGGAEKGIEWLGRVPFVGPPLSVAAQDAKDLNISGLAGDTAVALAQIFGPQILRGSTRPIRSLGTHFYNKGMGEVLSKNTAIKTLEKQQDVLDFAREHEVQPTRSGMDALEQLMLEAQHAKANDLWAQRDVRVGGPEVVEPLWDIIQQKERAMRPIPKPIRDQFIQLGEQNRNIPQWEDLRANIDKEVKSKSPISGISVMEKTPSTQALEASAAGISNMLKERVPNLAANNRTIHLAGLAKDAVEQFLLKEPRAHDEVAPLMAGAAVAGAMPGGAGVTHSPITWAGISAYLTRAALRDPVIATKLGTILRKYGYGSASELVGYLPRAALLDNGRDLR